MKTIVKYIIALVMLLAAWTGAQAQVLRDADFNSIGRINTNGMVRDEAGKALGEFSADGTVLGRSGKVMGKISRLEIFNPEGVRIGYINSDGTVHDGESKALGTVSLGDGKVADAKGNTLGFARGIRVDWIACYYFFHMFD